MGAKIRNPRKQFQYQVFIPGLNPFLCQKMKTPDMDFDVVTHGDTNFLVKTAGLLNIGKIMMDKISPADGLDEFIWNWFKVIQNTKLGGGATPDEYKANIAVEQYANDGITVVKRWIMEGCWPSKVNGIEFDRKASDNTVESIEFEVDEVN